MGGENINTKINNKEQKFTSRQFDASLPNQVFDFKLIVDPQTDIILTLYVVLPTSH